MPLCFIRKIEDITIGVWEIDLGEKEEKRRDRETRNVLQLVEAMCHDKKTIAHLPSGKPYFTDHSYQISISHAERYVAIALSSAHPVGIDIEGMRKQVKKVQHKFLQEEEIADITPTQELTHLLLYWCAKESIYKRVDIEGLSLRENIRIHSFTPTKTGTFQGEVIHPLLNNQHTLFYWVEEDYILTLAE